MEWYFLIIIIIIVIIIILLAVNYLFKGSALDIFKVGGTNLVLTTKEYGKYITIGEKTTLENISNTGFSLSHNSDNVTIHGKADTPIKFRLKTIQNGQMVNDETLTVKSDYNIMVHEWNEEKNFLGMITKYGMNEDKTVEFISIGAKTL